MTQRMRKSRLAFAALAVWCVALPAASQDVAETLSAEALFATDSGAEKSAALLRDLPNPVVLTRDQVSRIPLWASVANVGCCVLRRADSSADTPGELRDGCLLIRPDDQTPDTFALTMEAVRDGTVLETRRYHFELERPRDKDLSRSTDNRETCLVNARGWHETESAADGRTETDSGGGDASRNPQFEPVSVRSAVDGVRVRLEGLEWPCTGRADFMELFESSLFTVQTPSRQVQSGDLEGLGLLVLHGLDLPLASWEIAAVQQFYETGGAVWILGDLPAETEDTRPIRDLLATCGLAVADSATAGPPDGIHGDHPVTEGLPAMDRIAEFAPVAGEGGTTLLRRGAASIAMALENANGGRMLVMGTGAFIEDQAGDENTRRFLANARDWLCGTSTFEVDLAPSWNLLSMPLRCADTVGELFREADVRGTGDGGILLGWDVENQTYTTIGGDMSMHPQTGAWAYSDKGGSTRRAVGLPPEGDVQLAVGWNLVGPAANSVLPDVDTIGCPVWAWDAANQQYQPVAAGDRLAAGRAYWIYAKKDCTLHLGPAGRAPGEEIRSTRTRSLSPELPAGDLDALVDGNTRFALDLYAAVNEGDANLFMSPHSISVALAMVHAGAHADTETEMAETLHFDLPQDRLHAAFNALQLELASRRGGPDDGEDTPFRLHVVNQLWGQNGHAFLPAFLDTLAVNYGAGMRLMDFETEPEVSRQQINDWVADQTEQRIRDLIPSGGIKPLTRLVLTNAIYFKAAWDSPFPKNAAWPSAFTKLDGSQVSVPMMAQTQTYPYYQGADVQAVELPYSGRQLSMVLLVPDAGAFAAFDDSLNADKLSGILSQLVAIRLHLSMPKFGFESKLSLKTALGSLGMRIPFSANADFSGIDGTTDLQLADVFHKAFVAVDESGTEAAAATAVVVGTTSVMDPPRNLTVDRPFLFLIRDRETGAILFLGRVTDPR